MPSTTGKTDRQTGLWNIDFAAELRRMRLNACLTQEELAQRSGVSAATIRDIEQGRSTHPRQRSIRALAAALCTDTDAHPHPLPPVTAGPARDEPAPRSARVEQSSTISVLGPLTIRHGGMPVPIRLGRHHVILARLSLTPHTVVYRDELMELLWGPDVPESGVDLIHRYVARVRQLLAPARRAHQRCETLSLVPQGYRLNPTQGQLDLVDYRELVTRARSAPTGDAAPLLDAALARWHGDPVENVPELRDHPATVALVDEHVELAMWHSQLAERGPGREGAMRRLQRLARRHPLHEPLHARLIALLAATGRRAAAFETFEGIRRRLLDDLAVRPGPLLLAAHRGVLAADLPVATGRTSSADRATRARQSHPAPARRALSVR